MLNPDNLQRNLDKYAAAFAFLGGFSDELQKIALMAPVPSNMRPATIRPKINAISQPMPHALGTESNFTSEFKAVPPPRVKD